MLAVVSMALVSCGGGGKKITPKDTRFSYGDLGKIIEVVDEPCELTLEKVKGREGQVFKLKVKLKLVKDRFSNVEDPRDIAFYGALVANIALIDGNGDELLDLLDFKDTQQLRKFLTKEVGTVEEFIFEKKVHAAENSKIWYKEAVSFEPKGSCDCGKK